MTSAVPFANLPPGPPHDPTWALLDGKVGWRIAAPPSDVAVSPLDCALVLASLPTSDTSLVDQSGRFAGLVPPPNVALAPDGTAWLLDRVRGKLRRFDDCSCAFIDVPCTAGIGVGARQLAVPTAIATRGRDLLVLDAGNGAAPGRVLVFASHGFALRAIWMPPIGGTATPWRPSAVAVAPDGRTLVADIANGAIHIFDRAGQWRGAWEGFGAVAAMAIDRFGRLYTLVGGDTAVRISDRDENQLARATDVDAVRDCFCPPGLASDAMGRINLASRCAGAGWFDAAGQPSAAPAQPSFPASGVWLTTALDSFIARCPWHRVVLTLDLPARTGFALQTFTSEVEQPIELIAGLPVSAWTDVPSVDRIAAEALILSPPGRFLWLRATLTGGRHETPRLHAVRIEYPRISLRRYLPKAFAPDPVSGDFTDRLLGIFDQGFRSVESEIDGQGDLFDPRSAPAVSPVKGAPDMLTWLAGWLGIAFERSWPVPRRRRFLREAAKLFPCRGTLPGIRRALLLFLGLDVLSPARRGAACAPACAPPLPAWDPPPLLLEHWKIRRWLFLGAGRLGDAAVLWGETIMGRSQLDNTARFGVTRLDTTRDAVRDPFNADAYAFTVFVPGRLARTPREQSAVTRMLAAETPAWAKATIRFVLPRMRIGIQSSIGFDSVIGCWPEGVVLDTARLGRATVLSAGPDVDRGPRVGRSRVGAGMRI